MSPPITLYTSRFCGHSQRVERFLAEQNVPVAIISIDGNQDAQETVKSINNGYASVPTLVFPDGSTLTEPSLRELKQKLDQPLEPFAAGPNRFKILRDWLVPFGLIIAIFLADRLSKSWALQFLAEHGETTLNPFLTIRETYNRGIAFGFFQGVGPFIGWLTIGVVILMVIMLIKTPRQDRLTRWGLALIIGGALGNLVDRLAAGEVLDFIQIPLWQGTLNVADIAINVGLILLLAAMLFTRSRPHRNPETGEEYTSF